MFLMRHFHKINSNRNDKYRSKLDKLLGITILNFKQYPEFDMTESIAKTKASLQKNPDYRKAMIGYMSGNCYYNSKLSHGEPLTDAEKNNTNLLDKLVLQTEPISKPLYLFHGFEPGIKYNDNQWQIGTNTTFNFHLSKTPAHWVASRFSNHFSWYLNTKQNISHQHCLIDEYFPWYLGEQQNDTFHQIPPCYNIGFYNAIKTIFLQKYLFCVYPEENKWSHLSTDVRCPPEFYDKASIQEKQVLLLNEEFEFLSHKNEEFKLMDVVYKFDFKLPFVRKFYVMERI